MIKKFVNSRRVQKKNHITRFFFVKSTITATSFWKLFPWNQEKMLVSRKNKNSMDILKFYSSLTKNSWNQIFPLSNWFHEIFFKLEFFTLLLRAAWIFRETKLQRFISRKNSWMQDPRYKHEYLDKFPKPLAMMLLMMKVTNIYKHEIVDTRA